MTPTELEAPEETTRQIVVLGLPAAIWMLHLIASYATAAIWCSRLAGADGSLTAVRPLIFGYTVVALGGIVWFGVLGFRRHGPGLEAIPNDLDHPENRHRFLGFAAVLIAGLSAIATLLVAGSALPFEVCR